MEQLQNLDIEYLPPDLDFEELSGIDRFEHENYYNYAFNSNGPIPITQVAGYYKYLLFSFFLGPISILSDHSFIILTVLTTRIAHFVIDIIVSTRTKARFLKNIVTIILGLYQLNSFLHMINNSEQKKTTDRDLLMGIIVANILSILFSNLDRDKINTSRRKRYKPSYRHLAVLGFVCILPILFNEFLIYFKGYVHHMNLRNSVMILTMKATSLYYQSLNESIDILPALAYLVHPISCVLGVWHEHNLVPEETISSQSLINRFRRQVSSFLKSFLLTSLILTISANTYRIDEIFDFNDYSSMPNLFFSALEFRLSHYFVCYLATSLMKLWEDQQVKNFQVTSLARVEWPRSLVQVVIFWNIPMHQWLKRYVFKPAKNNLNLPIAIFLTYLVSSLLHGLKFHIWAVLLTLGLLTWVEFSLRAKLALKLNGCVLAHECTYSNDDMRCFKGHRRTIYNSPAVNIINSVFRILAITHLSYLGCIFIGNTDEMGYMDALKIWSSVHFYSHIMALLFYAFTTLV